MTKLLQLKQITGEAWGKMKESSRWGQMPMLQVEGGAELAQTKAIARFLAKQVCHVLRRTPKNDE
jgi:glutathione S-transferase